MVIVFRSLLRFVEPNLKVFHPKTNNQNYRYSKNEKRYYIKSNSLLMLVDGLHKATFAIPFTLLLLSLMFLDRVPIIFLISWLSASILLSIFRWRTHKLISKCGLSPNTIDRWQNRMLAIDFITGLLLGFSGFFLTFLNNEYQWILFVVLAAMSMNGAAVHAPIKRSFYFFITPLYVIFCANLLILSTSTSIILVFFLLLNAAFIYGNFSVMHKHIIENFSLSFINDKVTSELKQKNIELSKSHLQVEAASKAKSNFIGEISQEIKAPITNLNTLLTQAQQHADNPQVRNLLHLAHSTGNNIILLLNDLINVNLLEKGEFIRQDAPFNTRELFDEIAKINAVNVLNSHINLYCNIQANVPTKIVSDSARIKEITLNLLSNAFKHTTTGSIGITVDFHNVEDKHWLQVTVADTGVGIAEDKLDYIFQPFVKDESENQQGKGLGLAICQQLCKLLGGSIRAESILGKKSKFVFQIPVAIEFAEIPPYSGKKVLLVEQNEQQKQSIINQLNYLGVAYICEDQAKEAMAICAKDKNKFDTVIIGSQEPLAEKLLINLALRLHLKVITLAKQQKSNNYAFDEITQTQLCYPVSTAELQKALPYNS
jgi:signal transduction histidine kinase